MTWLDYVILGILGTSMAISVMRGLVRELFSIVTWIGAFLIGFQFSESLSTTLAPWVASSTFRSILAFMLVFTGTLLVGSALSHFLVRMLQKTGFGTMDRILGVFFGFLRGLLLVAVILMVGSYTDFTVSQAWARSSLIPTLQPMTHWLINFMPAEVHKKITEQRKAAQQKTSTLKKT
jgi:membrane protein required for colicin V production